MQAMVEQVLRQAGQAGQQARKLLQDHTKLQQVILGTPLPITVPPGSKRDQAEFKKIGAKLLWALDKIAKNFLLVVWKRRTAIAGTFSIENGALTAKPPDGYPSPKFKGFMSWDEAVNSGPLEDEDDNN